MAESYKVIKYDMLDMGVLRYAYGHISISSHHRVSSQKLKGKMAVIPMSDEIVRSAWDYIRYKTSRFWTPEKGNKIYVSSGCRFPRDIYRNSGYKIVRDAKDAEFIVVPKELECKKFWMHYDILTHNPVTNTLTVWTVRHEDDKLAQAIDDKEVFQAIKDFFGSWENNEYYDILNDKLEHNASVVFMPKHEAYEHILNGDYHDKHLVFETEVEVDYPNEISLDTLRVWKGYTDQHLLEKAILNSDWVKYPVTVLSFISLEKPFLTKPESAAFKLVLDSLGYKSNLSYGALLADRVVEPDDWNLLQDWIMDKLGLDSNGGYTSREAWVGMMTYKKLVKTAYAIAPIRINQPVQLTNILQLSEIK